jgi:glycosyltransferase involved in cell wall biosynthesis
VSVNVNLDGLDVASPPSGTTPKVSIGLPVYNGQRFLEETLDSLVAQTFQDWELIISDNASTDATDEICRRYLAADSRIRYVRNAQNIGFALNANRVFALSRGPYFKLATADDLCAPDLVARCVDVLDRDPDVVLCYGKTTLIDESSKVLGPYEDRLDLRAPRSVDRFRLVVGRLGRVHALQGVMRTATLRKTRLLGHYLGSDVVLVVELALHGQFHELPERLFYRRIHPTAFNSLTPEERELSNVEPGSDTRGNFYYWRQCTELLRAIGRAPISVSERLELVNEVLREGIRSRHRLISEAQTSFKGLWSR